jgi:hypothetical protein
MKPKARTDELVVKELGDEMLVYDLARHRAHCLNRTAAVVWRHCDGERTVAELAQLLEGEGELPSHETVVWMALDRLAKARLLQGEIVRPEGLGHLSRRAVLRKIGAIGGLAVLLPAIHSIVAPTVAQAASPTTSGACWSNPGANAGKCCINVTPNRICRRIFGVGVCTGAVC